MYTTKRETKLSVLLLGSIPLLSKHSYLSGDPTPKLASLTVRLDPSLHSLVAQWQDTLIYRITFSSYGS